MNTILSFCTIAALLTGVPDSFAGSGGEATGQRFTLPSPIEESTMPVEQAITARRSVRAYRDEPLCDATISRLLWSAQGITDAGRSLRAAPSAGATYPLEVYLVDHRGVFRYLPEDHALETIVDEDRRAALARAALAQQMVQDAPVNVVIAAIPQRTAGRYGAARAERYVHIEVGHAAQNIHLQAVALGLGSVPVGAFRDRQVQQALDLPDHHEPLYIIPIGRPR